MTEPDKTNQRDEVDDSSEQTLSTETNSMNAQVKPLIQTAPKKHFFCYTYALNYDYQVKD